MGGKEIVSLFLLPHHIVLWRLNGAVLAANAIDDLHSAHLLYRRCTVKPLTGLQPACLLNTLLRDYRPLILRTSANDYATPTLTR